MTETSIDRDEVRITPLRDGELFRVEWNPVRSAHSGRKVFRKCRDVNEDVLRRHLARLERNIGKWEGQRRERAESEHTEASWLLALLNERAQ